MAVDVASSDVVAWLLDGDPAVRLAVLTGLLGVLKAHAFVLTAATEINPGSVS